MTRRMRRNGSPGRALPRHPPGKTQATTAWRGDTLAPLALGAAVLALGALPPALPGRSLCCCARSCAL